MALDESTNFALQNLGTLNKNFSDAFAPLNNYASQNLNLAVAKQRAQQEQANKVSLLQQQEDAENQRQANSLQAQYGIARMQEESTTNRGLAIAKFQAAHEDAISVKKQADVIRGNPQARRVPGLKIADFSDTPEGNTSLVSAFTKATSDPEVLQTMDVGEAKGLTGEIKNIIGRLNTNTPGSAQSKQAVLSFLGTPGVTDLLIKKGRLTPQEIQSIAASGDSNKVIDAIQRTASAAYTPWGERDYLTQLIPAWNQAMATAGSQSSPSQMVDAGQLKALLDMRDTVLGRHNIYTAQSLQDALGDLAPAPTKLPPPPTSTALQTSPITKASIASDNPFGQPPATPPSNQVGLAGLFSKFFPQDANAPMSKATQLVNQLKSANPSGDQRENLKAAAFYATRYASDPATEYAVRQKLLDSYLTNSQATEGFRAGIGMAASPNAYDASQNLKDEAALKNMVAGLYTAPQQIQVPPYNGFMPQAPIGQPHPSVVPQINPFPPQINFNQVPQINPGL